MVKKNKPYWKNLPPPYEIEKDGFKMSDVKKDSEGWADASLYHPIPYDLVFMQTEKKSKPGWWTGQHWEGSRLVIEDKIFYWKLMPNDREKKD